MIKAKVIKNESNEIISVFVSGHSGYEETGKDIVCSAVSTAMYVSLGLLEKIESDFDFTSDKSNAIMKLNINANDELTNYVLDNLMDTLKGIVLDYSDFLKVDEIRR